MKDQELIKLLEKLKHYVIEYTNEQEDMLYSGLCIYVVQLETKGIISIHESAYLRSYIKSNMPLYPQNIKYGWMPYESEPRIKWIDEQIDILKKKRDTVKLQIGMRVKIKDDVEAFGVRDANTIKKITSDLPNYAGERAFGLDGDEGIWQIEDFVENIDYPNEKME